MPEFPASTDVVPVDGGISQLGISRRENVSGRLAGGSKLLAVPRRYAVMDYSYRNGFNTPSVATHTFPVTPSITVFPEPPVYLSGLVRLWRRIAARINSAPRLKCVLDITIQ